jgi:hypothetical protein
MLKSVLLATVLSCAAVGAYAQTAPTRPTSPSSSSSAPSAAPATVSTGDFNTKGDMAGSALIGAKVRNENNESIGKIDEIYVDKDAKITTVVVSVGGFLGVGSKDVGVKWSDLTFGKDGKSIVLTTSLNKDELKALPDYNKTERRQTAPPETAAAPPAKQPNPPSTSR